MTLLWIGASIVTVWPATWARVSRLRPVASAAWLCVQSARQGSFARIAKRGILKMTKSRVVYQTLPDQMPTEYDINTQKGRFEWVMAGWLPYAWIAYSGYLHAGRGAVVLPAHPTEGPGDPKYARIGVETKGSEFVQMIQEYDPENEIVFAFEFLDGSGYLDAGRYGVDDCPPKKAWAIVEEERQAAQGRKAH